MSVDQNLWRERYRELERQFEYAVRQAAAAWPNANTAPELRIRKLYLQTKGRRRIVCVADGANLDFCFTVRSGSEILLKTSFDRANVMELPVEITRATVEVDVRSHHSKRNVRAKMELGG